MSDQQEKGFYVVYGFVGMVEFTNLRDAMSQCERINQAGVYDAETGKVFLNQKWKPTLGEIADQVGAMKIEAKKDGLLMPWSAYYFLYLAMVFILIAGVITPWGWWR